MTDHVRSDLELAEKKLVRCVELSDVQLTNQYSAVFGRKNDSGKFEQVILDVDAIGVAKLLVLYYRQNNPETDEFSECKREEVCTVVGLQLHEGKFHIVDEFEDFAGLTKRNQPAPNLRPLWLGRWLNSNEGTRRLPGKSKAS
jgi:hypothetical protein